MKRGTLLIIISLSLLMITGGYLLIRFQQARQKQYHWYPLYKSKGILKKQPYSLYYFRELMDERGGSGRFMEIKKPLSGFFDPAKKRKGTYVIIGWTPFYTEAGLKSLMDFVREGNDLFMALEKIPDEILPFLSVDTASCGSLLYHTSVPEIKATLPGKAPGKTWNLILHNYTGDVDFSFISKAGGDCNIPCDRAGFIDERHCNYAIWSVGKGTIRIHTNPILFTNYFIITDEGFGYASAVFDFLDPDEDLYFDTFSLKPPGKTDYNQEDVPENWLSFILKSPGLKWSYFLLIFGTLLFLLFRARRRQRPVPVIEPNTDYSIEYLMTISRFFLKGDNHIQIARKKKQLFFRHLARKYGASLIKQNNALAQVIVARTGLTAPFVGRLLEDLYLLDNKEHLSNTELLDILNRIHYFYSKEG
jgi:hypothetical protein